MRAGIPWGTWCKAVISQPVGQWGYNQGMGWGVCDGDGEDGVVIGYCRQGRGNTMSVLLSWRLMDRGDCPRRGWIGPCGRRLLTKGMLGTLVAVVYVWWVKGLYRKGWWVGRCACLGQVVLPGCGCC